MKKLYIASPLGFSEAGKLFMYVKLIPLLENSGYMILDPWKLTDIDSINKVSAIEDYEERKSAWSQLNMVIGKNNEAAIIECDAVLAVLDGPDIDSGTASEIGYAAALGKRVFGYRNDFRNSGDNEGSRVNLQVEYFIYKNNGAIFSTLSEIEDGLNAYFE